MPHVAVHRGREKMSGVRKQHFEMGEIRKNNKQQNWKRQ
jgi:hypothetical protein